MLYLLWEGESKEIEVKKKSSKKKCDSSRSALFYTQTTKKGIQDLDHKCMIFGLPLPIWVEYARFNVCWSV